MRYEALRQRRAVLARSLMVCCLGLALTLANVARAAESAPRQDGQQTPSQPDSSGLYRLLMEGRGLLEAGRPQEAIEESFDQVIAAYETRYDKSPKRIYCARSPAETVLYASLASSQKQETEILTSEWADAYLLKGYALLELGRVAEARTTIERAVALSPQNAQYQEELAFAYQTEKDLARAMALYESAAAAAEFSPKETKISDLTRALRGQGYILIEQGKLDEAEKKYRKCLELDPNDRGSKNELQYIEQLRRGGK
jgi:tetratricopeptide (TPR) repeat protein